MRRRTMDFLLLAAGHGPSLVRRSMAKWPAQLKCRFALNYMPEGYRWGKAWAANPEERTAPRAALGNGLPGRNAGR